MVTKLAFIALAALTVASSGACAQATAVTLDEAVHEAVEHNLDILAERYNLSVAQARIITARLRPNPVFSLGADHLVQPGAGAGTINPPGPPEYSIRTDFLLERGGKRERRIAVAENARGVAELQLTNTIRTLVLDVDNAFVDVLLAKANVALAEDNLKAFRNIVQVNRTRVKAGDLAEVELLRTELAELQFENAVRQAEVRLATARVKLQLLLGRAGDQAVDAIGDLRRDAEPVSRPSLEQTALELRPDIQAIRRDQARSLAEVRLQLALGKVDYTVGSEYRRQQGLAGTGNTMGVFFSANLPVFNRNQGEIERARQEQKQLEARMRALTATVQSEVETAFLTYSNARSTLERIENTMLTKARDVRQITEYSYRRGEASLIEFLDAQRAYNETIQSYNEARADYARSLYTVDAVSGRNLK